MKGTPLADLEAPTLATALWLAVGQATGDTGRADAFALAQAELALLEATKASPLARSAIGPLSRISDVDGRVRASLPADLAAIANLDPDKLPEGTPEAVREIHAVLRPVRQSADQGLAGAAS